MYIAGRKRLRKAKRASGLFREKRRKCGSSTFFCSLQNSRNREPDSPQEYATRHRGNRHKSQGEKSWLLLFLKYIKNLPRELLKTKTQPRNLGNLHPSDLDWTRPCGTLSSKTASRGSFQKKSLFNSTTPRSFILLNPNVAMKKCPENVMSCGNTNELTQHRAKN